MSATSGRSTAAPVLAHAPLRSALAARLPGLPQALDDRAVLGALLDPAPGHVVEGCTVGGLHVHDDGTCGLRYELGVRDAATGRRSTVLVAGRVFPEPGPAQAYFERQVVPLESAVAGRPEVRALRRPVGLLPAAGLVVHAFPIDPGLPSLASATSPGSVLPVLRASLAGVGPGERGLAGCAVELVHYPRRERCVLRYHLRPGAGGSAGLPFSVVYGKVHAENLGARARLLLDALHRASPGLAVPRALGYDAGLRLVLLSAVPGEPGLAALVRGHLAGLPDRAADVPRLVRACAGLVARLHEAPVDPGGARTLPGELDAYAREVARLGHVGTSTRAELAGVLDELARRASGDPPLPACPAHGDLTPAQVLVDGGRVALVDLDGLTLAEPALDLGRFRAYVLLAAARSVERPSEVPRVDAVIEPLLAQYVRVRGLSVVEEAALRRRIPAYTGLALLGAAISACRQLKDRRLSTALSLVSEELS